MPARIEGMMNNQFKGWFLAMMLAYLCCLGGLLLVTWPRIFESPEAGARWILMIVMLALGSGILALAVAAYFNPANRCPRCGQFRAREDVGLEEMGIFKKALPLGGRRRYLDMWKTASYEKIKIHHRCKFCGHRWASVKTQKL